MTLKSCLIKRHKRLFLFLAVTGLVSSILSLVEIAQGHEPGPILALATYSVGILLGTMMCEEDKENG